MLFLDSFYPLHLRCLKVLSTLFNSLSQEEGLGVSVKKHCIT
jgi:hypothetical protein